MTDLTSLKNIFNEHTETPLLCFIEAVSGVVDYELKYHLDAENSSFAYEKDVFVFMHCMTERVWSAYRKNEKDTGESHNWVEPPNLKARLCYTMICKSGC